jgi:hypothetical protein
MLLTPVRNAIVSALENAERLQQFIRDMTGKALQVVDYGTGLHIPGAMVGFGTGTRIGGSGMTNGYFTVRFFLPFYRDEAFRQCLTVADMAMEALIHHRGFQHTDPLTGKKTAVVILPFEVSVVDEFELMNRDGRPQSSFWVVELSPRTMSGEMS